MAKAGAGVKKRRTAARQSESDQENGRLTELRRTTKMLDSLVERLRRQPRATVEIDGTGYECN